MVSKTKKKAPIKSIKDINRRRWRRKTPIKNVVAASSAVLSSIHRRISKLLTKLGITRLSSNRKRNSYKILKKTTTHFNLHQETSLNTVCKTLLFDDNESTTALLPPSILNRKTIFLDLDETLVHSTTSPPPDRFDFVVRPIIDGAPMDFYVVKRPGIDELLESLASRFEIVVFTAALKEYASLVLDRLDRNRFISHRLYRDSCRNIDGKLVKDLSHVGRDLKSVVIVDDNPVSFSNQPENAILIKPFVDDICDRELWKLKSFFDGSECFDDMRDAIKFYVAEIERRR
jgi:RNA polymerase II subunit A small phosphatase-like protein